MLHGNAFSGYECDVITGFQFVAVPISFSAKISCGAALLPRKHKICPRSYEELGKPVQLQFYCGRST